LRKIRTQTSCRRNPHIQARMSMSMLTVPMVLRNPNCPIVSPQNSSVLMQEAYQCSYSSRRLPSTNRRDKPLETSILDAFSAIISDLNLDNEPPVIIINWDLRHSFSFTTSFTNPMLTLPYSTAIVNPAGLLEPVSPHPAVLWRMDSIDPELLLSLNAHIRS